MHPAIKSYARDCIGRLPCKPVLVISGPPGTGKTRSIKAILRWWRDRMSYRNNLKPGEFVFSEMVYAMSMTAPRRSLATLFVAGGSFTEAESAAESVIGMLRPELLCIDDLGREPKWCPADTMASGLCDLLDARIDRRKNTIITTNLTGKEIGSRYGARLRSRLLGSADPVVYLTGRDMRVKL